MLDSRTKEQQQAAADACYADCKSAGHTCAGCHLDYLCKMPLDTAEWLFREFLPAIDPNGQVFGRMAGGRDAQGQ